MGVREGLLTLLAERPRHGYDLRAEFERRTAGLWGLNSGQVYTTLDRLTRDGLVSGEDDPDDTSGRRRLYALTDAGSGALDSWRAGLAAHTDAPREDLVMEILLAADGPTHTVLPVIDHARHRILQHLQELRRAQRDDPDGTLAAQLVTEVLLARREADLRWLDRTEALLRARDLAAASSNPADDHTSTPSKGVSR